jgi:protocatechuate 3,4-dioxygenase alpha subunit
VGVLARGLLTPLLTRVYFEDEANEQDPVLALVPAERRPTLIARPQGQGRYRWDIVLQGDGETVFLEA